MEANVKNREWVKNAAIIFLAVLLGLTFFSNTIMNRSLAQVSTAYVTSDTISAKVKGSGVAEAQGIYEVKGESTRKIVEVLAKVGKPVEAGDTLFVLSGGTSQELETALEELDSLRTAYSRSLASQPVYDYSEKEAEIAKATELVLAAEEEAAMARLLLDATNPHYAERLTYAEKRIEETKTAMNGAIDVYCRAVGIGVETFDVNEIDRIVADIGTAIAKATEEKEQAIADGDEQAAAAAAALITQKEAERTVAENLKWAYDQVRDALAERQSILTTAGPEVSAYNTALSACEAARSNLDNLQRALAAQQASDARSAAAAGVDLAEQRRRIQKQEELVKELAGDEADKIYAPVAGTVSAVNVTAGSFSSADAVLCTIEVPDMGYTMQFSVTKDQAKRLHVGDSASVTSFYWGSQINATLSAILPDPKNPQNNKLLVFDLTGDVTAGREVSLSIGERSSSYDLVIPSSAVRTDTNGTYVLMIEAKSNALGNRYFARRANVKVVASDDTKSAVTGDLNWGDYVITNSSAPVAVGDQVRMADN